APIVVNVTDGEPTDGDPEEWAQRLRGIRTRRGSLLLLTIHLSEHPRPPIQFPSSEAELVDEDAKRMFRMSSELPQFMRNRASSLGIPTQPGARGLVCNADLSSIVAALEVGTNLDSLR